jgi:hypothetical protein
MSTFTKLHGSPSERLASGVAALAKRHDAIGGAVISIQQRLDQLREDIDLLERTSPAPIVRTAQ